MEHLARRKNTNNWYYRESLPKDIRAILLATERAAPLEVWKSLGTADLKAAKLKRVQVRAEQHRQWDTLRSASARQGKTPSFEEMANGVFDMVHGRFITVHREQLRKQFAANADPGGLIQSRKNAVAVAAILPSADDQLAMDRLAMAVCHDRGWELRFDTPEGIAVTETLVGLVQRAVQLARTAVIDELEGKPPETERETVIKRMGARPSRVAAAGASIKELFELYASAQIRAGDKSADTLNADRKVADQFAEFVGPTRDVASVEKSELRDFRNALQQVPVKWTSRNDLAKLTLRDAAAKWQATGGAVRNSRTVAREWSGLSGFFAWLVTEGYLDENRAIGLAPKFNKRRGKYPVYTQEKLEAVFASPLFIGSLGPGKEHLSGGQMTSGWRYWLPLCALYSGARAGEIAQLLCDDVHQDNGVWVFDFNEDETPASADHGKRLKTISSRRIVPVHDALIGLGLLAYVKERLRLGGGRLFPDITPCTRGALSTQPSKFWQRYLKRLNIKEPGLALHSFRHTFTDECRRNGIADALIGSLLGHAKGTMTSDYGDLVEGNLAQRQGVIGAISYGSLHPLGKEASAM